jgi:hypothetical protein
MVYRHDLKFKRVLVLSFLGKMLAVITSILASCLLAQTPPTPDRWKNAEPAVALADPDFYRLSIDERRNVLKRIDRKFSQMSVERQEAYMWKLETANLPKPAPPKQVFTWAPNAPGTSVAGPVKGLAGAGLGVDVTLFREDFFRAQLRITNVSAAPVEIRPRTFVLNAVKPKPAVLCYEYADRAALEMINADVRRNSGPHASTPMLSGGTGRSVTSMSGDPSIHVAGGRRDGPEESVQDRAQRALTTYLPEGPLAPHTTIEGNVYFQRHKNAEEFVLRVYVGEFAFDFPMTVSKR